MKKVNIMPQCEGREGKKTDKDIELKKLELSSEEHRTQYYTAIGVHFSILVAITAALISLNLGLAVNSFSTTVIGIYSVSISVPSPNFWYYLWDVVLGAVGAYVFIDAWKLIDDYKKRRPQLDKLMERIENGLSIGTIEQARLFLEGKFVYEQ